jgi:hypothetical protein
MVNFYRRFLPKIAQIRAPLTNLLNLICQDPELHASKICIRAAAVRRMSRPSR